MPNTPLNPDALEKASREVFREVLGFDKSQSTRVARRAIAAYLAVAQPEVNSVEELDQLPAESVLLDADNCVVQILHNGEQYPNGDPFREYCMVGDTRVYEPDEVALPAHVLYRPEVKS